MKKLIVGLLPVMALTFTIVSAGIITVEDVKQTSSCISSQSDDRYYYITHDNYTVFPDDTFGNNVDSLISRGPYTSVQIRRNGILSNCNDWGRISNVVSASDSDGALVIANDDGCILNKPNYTKINNPTAIDAQIHYTIGYTKIFDGGKTTLDSKLYHRNQGVNVWTCYPGGEQEADSKKCPTVSVKYGDQNYHKGECLNYRVFRCGDGLINRPDGTNNYNNGSYNEECDPNHPDRKSGKDGQTCNPNTCKIEYDAPVCSSNYNKKKVYTSNSTPYLKGLDSENLCNLGKLTQNTFKQIGTPIQYTWGCTNGTQSTSSNECKFEQYRCGDGQWNGGGDWSNFINGPHYEVCDPTAPEWKNRTDGQVCNNDCIYGDAICGLASSTTPVYNPNYPTSRIKESELCKTGKLKEGSFSGPDANGNYTWICINGTKESNPSCGAKDLRCGDGKKNGNEQCDYRDTENKEGWGGKWERCNDRCERESISQNGPVCNPSISGHTEYTTYSTDWLNRNSGLCSVGEVTDFKSDWSLGNQRKFTWRCSNDDLDIVCTAKQERCGDGIKNGSEVCDYKDTEHKNGRGDGCSTTCDKATYETAECGSDFNEKVKTSRNTRYQDISKPWINENTDGLCKKGSVEHFTVHTELNNGGYTYTWQCNNNGNYSDTCGAYQEWCGDGKKNGNEQCDYKDENEINRGNDGCSMSCEKKIQPDNGECNDTFYYTLRHGWKYTFYDKFIPGGTRYLYDFDVKFDEKTPYDFNQGENPTFSWMDDLGDGVYKVVSTTRRVIKSQPQYEVKTHPNFGDSSDDDIYIEYTIKYSDKAYSSKPDDSKLKTHKECVYYKISRCGDGVLDTEYNEECDPEAEPWKSDHSCDPETCKKLPICNSKYNGQELVNLEKGDYLCEFGTVKNFKYNEATRTWTWECEAAGTGTQCSAKKTYNGTWNLEKTLISDSKYVTQTGQELVWKIKVTAIGGDVKDMQIKDYLPKVLEYKSYTSKLPSGVTMENNQPTTGHDTTGDYLQWETKGTLKEDDSIILEVTTTVKTMPTSGDNYKNVACASPEGEKDKCDSEPVKTEGSLDINKTLIGKLYVENTGEILTWEVKVSASGGDVENFEIWDIMPNKLSFVSAELTGATYGIQITKKDKTTASGDYHTVHYWDAKGILSGGNSITMLVKTKVETMPTSGESLRNVACVIKNDKTLECDDDKLKSPKLRIKKYILSGNSEIKTGNVKIGDEITYKIYFGNSGNAEATITSIKDFLPKNVKYKSSEIHINRNASHASGTQKGDEEFKGYKIVDGVYMDIYGGMTLQPRDNGYIIIKAEVLSDNKDNRTNFACIYLNNEVVDCDDATHTFTEETMSCIPTLSPSSFSDVCSSDTSSFSTTVTCKSSRESDIEILCDGVVVKTGHASQLTGTCSATTNNIDHKAQCKINGSLTGTDGKSCEASFRRNTKSCGGGSSCFVAGTKVLMGDGETWKNIEDVEIGDYVMGESGPNEVKGFDRPKLGDRNLWSINGSKAFVSDEHPFKTEDGWKAIDEVLAKFEIMEALKSGWLIKDEQTEDLLKIEKLEVGDVLIMENGKTRKIESLEKGTAINGSGTQLYNFRLNGDNTYYANGYLVHNKGGGGGPSSSPVCEKIKIDSNSITCSSTEAKAYFRLECGDKTYYSKNKDRDYTFENVECEDSESVKCAVSKDGDRDGTWESNNACTKKQAQTLPQGCFNVNAGNFSIEEGEIMPFYWNLKNLDDDAFGENTSKDNYTEIKGEIYDAKHIYDEYSKPENNNCSDGQNGKIATNSMVCTFKIYDGSGYHKGVQNGISKTTSLYTVEGPCLASSSVIKENNLIKARYEAMKETYCNNSNSTDCVFYYGDGSSSAVLPTAVYYIENFGSGASVGVDAGDFEDTWDLAGKPENKKSYGEYKIELSSVKYLQCEDGTWQKKEPVLDPPCQNDFVLTNSYTVQKTPSGNLTASMKELQKYYNYSGTMTFDTLLNAIQSTTYEPNDNVNGAMDKFINKYKKLAVTVDTSKSKLLKGGNATVSKVPGKSIYFVSGSIAINGSKQNIDTPFTIVQTNGNATINGNVGHNMMLLTNGNIIFQGGCTSDQTVKGIFYARGNLSRNGVGKNNSIKSDTWCTYGGLHVKGVLIGLNFNQLMKASRSNLNMWFKAKGNDNEIKNQRRRYIMDGASVVIEYSPSIFTKSTMPPGAEDFTTALSIYKN